jgi:hypothetical protein
VAKTDLPRPSLATKAKKMREPQSASVVHPETLANGSSLLADVCVAQGHVAGTGEHARAAAELQPWNAATPKKILRLQTEQANRP